MSRCLRRNSGPGQVPQQSHVDTGMAKVAGGGEILDFSGDAAQQLESLVFGGVSGGCSAEGRGATQPAGEVVAGVMREGVEQGHRAKVRLTQTRFEGHDNRIGQKSDVFRKKT